MNIAKLNFNEVYLKFNYDLKDTTTISGSYAKTFGDEVETVGQKLSGDSFWAKAVNKYAGMNYSAFINSYRVKHAAELISKDPRMKMEEVAKLSGFNTLPSFNAAFKSVMNERPSEYQAKVHRK